MDAFVGALVGSLVGVMGGSFVGVLVGSLVGVSVGSRARTSNDRARTLVCAHDQVFRNIENSCERKRVHEN